MNLRFSSSLDGPSPRAGGKPGLAYTNTRPQRTIPPGRGDTCAARATAPWSSDHPPGQGGNKISKWIQQHLHGPSPRAGGKHARQARLLLQVRTIPPGRGETRGCVVGCIARPDHPPGQGGNIRLRRWSCVVFGPSPRAGGKLKVPGARRAGPRTIPPGRGETLHSQGLQLIVVRIRAVNLASEHAFLPSAS